MVDIKVSSVTIGGRSYNKDKSGYPTSPTVYSGVEITWGAGSCIEQSEPSRVNMSLWVPKTQQSFIPTLGEVITISGGSVGASGVINAVSLFAGKVEQVTMKDDHKVDGGYFVKVIGSDALAEAGRLRLSDNPWPSEGVTTRQNRIRDLAAKSGVAFRSSDSTDLGSTETIGTRVIPRDVDSFPALEAFQRTTMTIGRTAVSVNNTVQPNATLKLPAVISNTTASPSAYYRWKGTPGSSASEYVVSGAVQRTNWAVNPSGQVSSSGYAVIPGNGTASIIRYISSNGRNGNIQVATKWTAQATGTGGPVGISYIDSTVTGTSATKISIGAWVKYETSGYLAMVNYGGADMRLRVEFYNGSTKLVTWVQPEEYVEPRVWRYMKIQNINAPSDFTSIKLLIEDTGGWTSYDNTSYYAVDGIIIEKASTVGTYFEGSSIHKSIQAALVPTSGVPVLTTSMIEDDAFAIDTSKVVNEIKAEMKLWNADTNGLTDADQLFTDEVGSRKTTPQTRTLSTDWCIQDTYKAVDLPNSVMVTKGKLLLSAQSKAQWRLSQTVRLVPSQIPSSVDITPMLSEATRFGSLFNLSDAPDKLPKYMRVHAGRILLGETVELEFEVEPVEYSAPVPLTKNNLNGDSIASYYTIGSYKNITGNILRQVGAR